MFEIYIVLAIWGPPPGLHGGHVYHLNNFQSLSPKDDSCQVWLNPAMRFQEEDGTVTFYIEPPPPTNLLPPQGPNGATLKAVMNKSYSSPKEVSTH